MESYILVYGFIFGFNLYIFIGGPTWNVYSSESEKSKSKRKCFNPLAPILLIRHRNLTLVILFWIWIIAIHFVVNILIPVGYNATYNFNASEIGLVYFAPGAGLMFGSFAGGILSDYLLKKRSNEIYYPEMRLKGAWIVVPVIPITILGYAIFLVKGVHISLTVTALFLGNFILKIFLQIFIYEKLLFFF